MKLLNIKDGDYELVTDTYKAYELFPYKDMDEEVDTFIEANSFSFFEKDFISPFFSPMPSQRHTAFMNLSI